MTLFILYFSIATVLLYTEALDSYRTKSKFNIGESVIFSLTWIISLPLSIYTIWKELK